MPMRSFTYDDKADAFIFALFVTSRLLYVLMFFHIAVLILQSRFPAYPLFSARALWSSRVLLFSCSSSCVVHPGRNCGGGFRWEDIQRSTVFSDCSFVDSSNAPAIATAVVPVILGQCLCHVSFAHSSGQNDLHQGQRQVGGFVGFSTCTSVSTGWLSDSSRPILLVLQRAAGRVPAKKPSLLN